MSCLILERREGYLYRRGGRSIGFAFVGKGGAGPIAALDADDLAVELLHVEGRAHALGVNRLNLQVPGVNAVAVRHLVGRGFQIDAWVNPAHVEPSIRAVPPLHRLQSAVPLTC